MYDFGSIDDIPVEEYVFKNGLAHFNMILSDGNTNTDARKTLIIPGFRMNEKGSIVPLREDRNLATFPPNKDNVERQIRALISASTVKSSDKICICVNEESEEIGMAVIPNKKWYPVYSMI